MSASILYWIWTKAKDCHFGIPLPTSNFATTSIGFCSIFYEKYSFLCHESFFLKVVVRFGKYANLPALPNAILAIT